MGPPLQKDSRLIGQRFRLLVCLIPPAFTPGTCGLAGRLYPSGAPEADADRLSLHQDRHPAVALGEPQHLGHGLGVGFDIPKNDRQPFVSLGLPGPLGKGSDLLAEDGDFLQ